MEVDSNFMTDAVLYYNIPKMVPPARSDGRAILSPLTALTGKPATCPRGAGSCPASATMRNGGSPNDAEGRRLGGPPLERKSKGRRSAFYTWFKRKRRSPSPATTIAAPDTPCSSHSSDGHSTVSSRRTAESVSSGATDGDDIIDGTYVKVLGGVSYVKEKLQPKVTLPEYQNVPGDTVDPFASKVSRWQKQARWLSRRRLERKHRKATDDESIDIGIIYCADDSLQWAEFIEKDLSNLLSSNSCAPIPKIQMFKLESYAAAKCELIVQENLFKTAKLQIAIISPSMVSLLSSRSDLKLDRLFNPKSIIALMLKVTPLQMYDNAALSSAFCCFEEWIHMDVKERNSHFVCSLRAQVLQLLIDCNAYNGFSVPTNFSLCPRKVSKKSNRVHILLKTPTSPNSAKEVILHSKHDDRSNTGVVSVTFHNPYTLIFTVPEKYLKTTSCFLYVYVTVERKSLGWRELKCEGSLEVLVTALETICDPIEIMTQALGISSMHGSLDNVLATRLKRNMPLELLTNPDENCADSISECHLPTSLHFGAHFGLTDFCRALLQVPGSRLTNTCRNSKGHTPAVLALKAGFIDLANMLETYACDSIAEESSFHHLDESRSGHPYCLNPTDCDVPPPVPSRTSTPEVSLARPDVRTGSFCLPKSEDKFDLQKSEDRCSLQNSEGGVSLQTSDSSGGLQASDGGFCPQKSEGSFGHHSFEGDSDRRLIANGFEYSYQNNFMDEDSYVDMYQKSIQTPERKV